MSNIYQPIKPILDQFNKLLNEVNEISNNKLLSNQYELKQKCNIFKKYVLINKLKIEIFIINNNYYISKNFIDLLLYEKCSFMNLSRHTNEYLFLPKKSDFSKLIKKKILIFT
jgi:hypothetical protein